MVFDMFWRSSQHIHSSSTWIVLTYTQFMHKEWWSLTSLEDWWSSGYWWSIDKPGMTSITYWRWWWGHTQLNLNFEEFDIPNLYLQQSRSQGLKSCEGSNTLISMMILAAAALKKVWREDLYQPVFDWDEWWQKVSKYDLLMGPYIRYVQWCLLDEFNDVLYDNVGWQWRGKVITLVYI